MSEAQSELDRQEWKRQNTDRALYDSSIQLQSKREELYQAIQFTDQSQKRKRIGYPRLVHLRQTTLYSKARVLHTHTLTFALGFLRREAGERESSTPSPYSKMHRSCTTKLSCYSDLALKWRPLHLQSGLKSFDCVAPCVEDTAHKTHSKTPSVWPIAWQQLLSTRTRRNSQPCRTFPVHLCLAPKLLQVCFFFLVSDGSLCIVSRTLLPTRSDARVRFDNFSTFRPQKSPKSRGHEKQSC